MSVACILSPHCAGTSRHFRRRWSNRVFLSFFFEERWFNQIDDVVNLAVCRSWIFIFFLKSILGNNSSSCDSFELEYIKKYKCHVSVTNLDAFFISLICKRVLLYLKDILVDDPNPMQKKLKRERLVCARARPVYSFQIRRIMLTCWNIRQFTD